MEKAAERKMKIKSTLDRGIPMVWRSGFLVLFVAVYNLLPLQSVNNQIEIELIKLTSRGEAAQPSELQAILPAASEYTTLAQTGVLRDNLTEQLPGSSASSSIVTSDPRIIAMREFLIDYNSPMYPYADVFVKEADKYGLDWRLVASISGVESAFGNLIPYQSYNGWGWKGDPTREWSHFSGWSEGIKVVTERLALGYGIHMTPFEIEPIYCPPCGQQAGHYWANGVQNFMNELTYYLENLE